MCKETRINTTNELQFDSAVILFPQESALDSSTFGVTSSSASSKQIKDEQNAVLPSDTNTPHSDNNTMSQQEDDEDPHDDTMITFLTGRTKSERSSKERAIIFLFKVSPFFCCSFLLVLFTWVN